MRWLLRVGVVALKRLDERLPSVAVTMPDKARFIALIAPIQDDVAKELKATDLLQIVRSHAK